MSPWVLALGAALNFLGGQQATSQQSEANQIAGRNVALQERVMNYLLGRRQQLYDPIEERTILPGMQARATQSPWFAGEWLGQARRLRQPMRFAASA